MPDGQQIIDTTGMVTAKEAARVLGVSRAYIYVLMDRREITHVRIGGARRIPRQALQEYIERNTVEA